MKRLKPRHTLASRIRPPFRAGKGTTGGEGKRSPFNSGTGQGKSRRRLRELPDQNKHQVGENTLRALGRTNLRIDRGPFKKKKKGKGEGQKSASEKQGGEIAGAWPGTGKDPAAL